MGNLINNATSQMGVRVTVKADTPIGTAVALTGAAAREVDAATSGDIVAGHLFAKPRYFPGTGTMITRYSEEREALFEGAVAPGDLVKIGTADGEGNQRYTAFDPATESHELIAGLCIEGATDAEGSILTS
mgnify:CR=1 FL=1